MVHIALWHQGSFTITLENLSTTLTDAILTISMNRLKVNAVSVGLLNDLEQDFNHASKNNNIKGVHLRSNFRYLSSKLFIHKNSLSTSLVEHSQLVLTFHLYMNSVLCVIHQPLINLFFIHLVVV